MNKIISIDNLPNIFSSSKITTMGKLTNRVVSYALKKHLKEKKLIKIKRGVYSKVANPFYVASALYKGYIGFSSALYLYRLKNEIEANVIVCVPKTEKKVRFLDKILLPVNVSDQFYGFSIITTEGLDIPISTFPKIVFDMFYRPKYANFYDLYNAINNRRMNSKEWRSLFYYAEKSNLVTIRRLGYGLENKAPKWLTAKLLKISDKGSRTSFFFSHKPIGYNAKWDIFDDINVKRWENAV